MRVDITSKDHLPISNPCSFKNQSLELMCSGNMIQRNSITGMSEVENKLNSPKGTTSFDACCPSKLLDVRNFSFLSCQPAGLNQEIQSILTYWHISYAYWLLLATIFYIKVKKSVKVILHKKVFSCTLHRVIFNKGFAVEERPAAPVRRPLFSGNLFSHDVSHCVLKQLQQ